MNDASLDREIESMLAAEPSPEFHARIRMRVAHEPEPGNWRAWWMLALPGVVAVAITVVVVWPSREAPSSNGSVVPTPHVAEILKPALPESDVRPPTVDTAAVSVASVAAPARRTTNTARPADVVPVVADEDARAFDALLSTIRNRNVVLVLDDSPTSALATSSLAIAPIAIEPVPTTVEGGLE